MIKKLGWKDYISVIRAGPEIRGLYLDHPYLYISYSGGLIISEITNPFNPKILTSLDNPFPGTSIRDVEVYDNYAYLSIYGKGIQVVDITDKSGPGYGQLVTLPGYNRPWRAFADKEYLYVASGTDNRLDILDISNPEKPYIRGSYSSNTGKNSFSGVAVKDNFAYVTEYHNGIRVIDVSDPENPFEINNLMDINANDIKILGKYAYVSVRYQGFDIIDISNPEKIFIAGKGSGLGGYIEGIFPSHGYTYIAGESKGFGIYRTSDPLNPEILAQIPVIGGIDSIAVKDNFAYIGAHNDGMWIIDVHDKKNPSEVSFIAAPGRFDDVDLIDDYLFSAGQWGGLNMIDISDPYNPAPVFLDYKDNIGSVLADGDYVYTSAGIVDVKNPASPKYLSKAAFFKGRLSLLDKNHLLVAKYTGDSYGIQVIDIKDKSVPLLITTYNSKTRYYDIKCYSDKAVTLTGNSLQIIDFSDIYNPVLIDEINYRGKWSGSSIDLEEKICYSAGGPAESIKIFELNEFSQINLINSADIRGVYNCIDYEDGYIYAGQKFGMNIFSSDKIFADQILDNKYRVQTTSSEIENQNLDCLKSVQPELTFILPILVVMTALISAFHSRQKT